MTRACRAVWSATPCAPSAPARTAPEDAEGLARDRCVLELVDYGTGVSTELGLEP